jgi:hypothetical protein
VVSATSAIVTWSGWAFGAASFALSAASERRVRAERRKSERLASKLSSRQPLRPGLAVESQLTASQAQLRAFLVHAAAGHQTVAAAAARAKGVGATSDDVEHMTRDLAKAGLLSYQGHLGPDTRLSLTN